MNPHKTLFKNSPIHQTDNIIKSKFLNSLKLINFLYLLCGFRNLSFCVWPSKFLILKGSRVNIFDEFFRTGIFILLSFIFLQRPPFYYFYYDLFRFWVTFLVVRYSEKITIKFIENMLNYDFKYSALPTLIGTPAIKNIFMISILILFIIFKITIQIILTFMIIRRRFNIMEFITNFVFHIPRLTDFVIVFSACFFLKQIGYRFSILNKFWKRLPGELIRAPGHWSKDEIAMLIESCRLLHANLSDILKTFSYAYGPILVFFLLFLFIDMAYSMFIILYLNRAMTAAILIFAQDSLIIIVLLKQATWTFNRKRKIISFLRLCQIADLPEEIRIQLQFFMKQVSCYDNNELAASGTFKYNLKLILSIAVALVKCFSIMIQMKSQERFLSFVSLTSDYIQQNKTINP
ncbi:uncharacterized protein LOC126902523 [Daktulosphaira vitifoliae]|uniref:uncharacterized protein LOC126902523 n=1 Tax=Daktulosphaira vitifoliae TaxID=58002 RepID=UPI0021AABBF5|nr:uncharacterized protein LOC126902523 [Daktulosphaira vitifoliae]